MIKRQGVFISSSYQVHWSVLIQTGFILVTDTRSYPVLEHFDEKGQEKVTFQGRGKQARYPSGKPGSCTRREQSGVPLPSSQLPEPRQHRGRPCLRGSAGTEGCSRRDAARRGAHRVPAGFGRCCFHPLLSNAALPAHGPPAAGGSIGPTSVPPAPHADVTHPPGTPGAEVNPRQFQTQGLIRVWVYNDNNSG